MARILVCVGSARRDGYTSQLVDALCQGARADASVTVQVVRLLDYAFGPCTSCYQCIRNETHRCVIKDDMGSLGEGGLWQLVEQANALVLASPVHCWGADALTHLFVERLYPFLWSGELRGIPVATLASASNQGFQHAAERMLCQWAFTMGSRYVGGVAAHAADYATALNDARHLGRCLAEAATADAAGRRPLADEEMWLAYMDAPWSCYPEYARNLAGDGETVTGSIIARSLAQGRFQDGQARALLEEAQEHYGRYVHHRQLGETRQAIGCLVKASALWTHATWKEFLEEKLIKVPPPKSYRPLGEHPTDIAEA